MKTLLPILTLIAWALITNARGADEPTPDPDAVFREPFTLKLHVDKERFYEEEFGKIPYVHSGDVYLFKGDEFGLTLDIREGQIRSVKYQKELQKADVTLKFTQEVKPGKPAMMMLRIHNNTGHTIELDALMTVPDREGLARTSMIPVRAGLSSFEMWPHPIVQLVLRNLRISK